MHSSVTRRALLALSLAASAVLTACGSSSVESALEPERFLSVGDGYSDIGQGPNGTRPTVNDGSLNWTQQIAADYGKTLTAANAGGLSWAQAYSRVTQPDTTGHDAPSITEQVTSLLATTSFGAKDVILLSGGMSDVYAEVEAAGGTVTDAVRTNVTQAGTEYGQQVHRLVNAGAQYVVVTGVYNMGKTPWGLSRGEDVSKQIEDLSRRFNDAALIEINSLASRYPRVHRGRRLRLHHQHADPRRRIRQVPVGRLAAPDAAHEPRVRRPLVLGRHGLAARKPLVSRAARAASGP
jgi:phospholipase/lecithinase/hemolysin